MNVARECRMERGKSQGSLEKHLIWRNLAKHVCRGEHRHTTGLNPFPYDQTKADRVTTSIRGKNAVIYPKDNMSCVLTCGPRQKFGMT